MFFGLLRRALTDGTPELSNLLSCDEVYGVMNKQTVSELCGDILDELSFDNKELKEEWKISAYRCMSHFYSYHEFQNDLLSELNEAGLKTVILKGSAAASNYPRPELREMGDIDLLFKPSDFETAAKFFNDRGYRILETTPRHICFFKDGFEVEAHNSMVPLRDGTESAFDKKLFEGFDKIKEKAADNDGEYMFPCFDVTENGLVLLEHARIHMNSGIGFKQILDWWMFARKEITDDVWNGGFGKATRGLGLDTLAITMTKLCKDTIGPADNITWCDSADMELVETLKEAAFLSGNMGRTDSADRVRLSLERKRGFFNILSVLEREGLETWEAAKKHRILRPFAWIYRGLYYFEALKKDGAISPDNIIREAEDSKRFQDMLSVMNAKRDDEGYYL
ncbi:MAG: nucleotidyltransferase family protein [Eubacteriales bacterium]|nr:nucleotidyltransferase family protein [Eubacteriales bacterium]